MTVLIVQSIKAQNLSIFQTNLSSNVYKVTAVETVDSQLVFNRIEKGMNFYMQNTWSWSLKSDSFIEHRIAIVNTNYITRYLHQKQAFQNTWSDKYFSLSNSLGVGYTRRKRFSKFYGQTELSANAYLVNLFNNLEEKKHAQAYVHFGVQCSQSILFKLFESTEVGPFINLNIDYGNNGYQDFVGSRFPLGMSNGIASLGGRIGLAIRI